MTNEVFLKDLQAAGRRATALSALKQLLVSRDGCGIENVPGDLTYDPSTILAPELRALATELHNALIAENIDGLNALLDRWFSGNLTYQSDTATQSSKSAAIAALRSDMIALRKQLERITSSRPIGTTSELAKRLADRPARTSASVSAGLLTR